MGPVELEHNYLRWGGSSKRGRKVLGQYGQGGKAAIGHLGASFTVEASRPGDDTAWRFADPDYRDRSKLKTAARKECWKLEVRAPLSCRSEANDEKIEAGGRWPRSRRCPLAIRVGLENRLSGKP
jgi:hypothetical protein